MSNGVERLIQEARGKQLRGQQVNDYVHGRIAEQSNRQESAARVADESR